MLHMATPKFKPVQFVMVRDPKVIRRVNAIRRGLHRSGQHNPSAERVVRECLAEHLTPQEKTDGKRKR